MRSASTNASARAAVLAATASWLHTLAAWPLPGPPRCTSLSPSASRTGRARSTAASLPPIMKVSVPAAAPATPPETGASRYCRPFAAAAACRSLVVATSMEDESITSAPAGSRARAAPAPVSTSRTMAPFGSIVRKTSAPSAAAATESTISTPRPAAACLAASAWSKPRTRCPAWTRFADIGAPMLPSPTNPIISMLSPSTCGAVSYGGLLTAWRQPAKVPPRRADLHVPCPRRTSGRAAKVNLGESSRPRGDTVAADAGPPLSGVTVIEIGNFLAAPFAAMQLADLGAQVIKVESPQGGDAVRAVGPFLAGESSPFLRINRNKQSVALDLRTAGGLAAARTLIERADVLIENL